MLYANYINKTGRKKKMSRGLPKPLRTRKESCVCAEKTPESHLDSKEVKPVNPKGNQPWIFTGRTDAKDEALILGHLMWRANSLEKTLMLGKIVGRRGGDDRGWDGWMASPTQLTWVWVDSGSGWWTGRPGMLLFMGLQRVGHNWVTELNWRL